MNALIKKHEGFSENAYKCPAGIWTIGYGNTKWENGTPVKKGDTITKEKAEALLNHYLINNVRPKIADLQLTEYQYEALESLIYNIGWTAFARSKCYKAIKAKDWGTAFNNWDWISAGGKVLNGLIKRRAEEIAMFFTEI
jgi:lysozyme